MKVKFLFAFLFISCVGFTRADVVVLQNLNTATATVTQGTGDLNTNIGFSTTAFSSSLSRLILFGTANQTGVAANFKLAGIGSATRISATEIASGQYAFNLAGVGGISSMVARTYYLELRNFSTGSAFFTTTDATMTTLNGAGFVGENYDANNLRFQFEGNSTAIPEPSTLILTATALTAGAVGAWIKRRRQKAAESVT